MREELNTSITGVQLLCLLFSTVAYADPSGAQVVNCLVNYAHPDPTTLNITNSPGSIINWNNISIKNHWITRFIQSSVSSAVLNRVISQHPSSLPGKLLSNGRVFLINPNGIVFSQNAVIDTAGSSPQRRSL